MHIFKNKVIIILIFIILLGLTFRVVSLHENPPGFFCDEASVGYNAYTITHHGTDEYGTKFPIFFQAFGEYKSPIQIYSTVPFIVLFGLSEFSTRLPSAIYGALGIFAIFILTRELFKKKPYNQYISLVSALLLAVSPWHIHFSRTSMEGISAYVTFAIFGLFFFMKFIHEKKYFFLSIIFFVLALYSYFPGRIFIPLFGIGISLLYIRDFLAYKRSILVGIPVLLMLLTPIIFHMNSPEGKSRWNQVAIIAHPPKHEKIHEHVFNNYLSHFSMDFLFFKGDVDMPGQFITRHSVKGIGELYIFQLPFLIVGSIYMLFKHTRISFILFVWLLLYPVGSMFTLDESAQATRSIIGVVPFQLISAIGIVVILMYLFKRIPILTLGIGLMLSLWVFHSVQDYTNKYFREYPHYSADFWGWQYGARDIVTYFITHESRYDELFMEGAFNGAHIFFNFYAPNDCRSCTLGLPHERYDITKRQLFAVTPYYLEEHPEIQFKILKTIFYPDKKVAFQIGEIVQ